MQAYRDAIRRRVCSFCVDGVFDENDRFIRCGLPANRACPIESYLPEAVEIVESIDSPRMDDYVDMLREKVCSQCEHSQNGECDLRLKADCALDRYFMLVVDAVESVREARMN